MPILQQKLVMKSIEALHDEALSLATETTNKQGTKVSSAVLNAATPTQVSLVDATSDTSANATPEIADDHDIMARIDHLLKKLDDDDDVAISPLTDGGPQSNTEDMTSNAIDTATTDNKAMDNPTNHERPMLSNATDHANENAKLDLAEDKIAKEKGVKPLGKSSDDTSNDMTMDAQPGKTVPSDQAQALANIAAAIYQAGQQAVDTVVADTSQNNTVPFDMDVLLTTVAEEVRRTVAAVMITELPQMVRDAVSEAIRSIPADARGQSTPATVNPPKAKSVTTRKTTATKKAVGKKARTKKAATKSPHKKKGADKTTPST